MMVQKGVKTLGKFLFGNSWSNVEVLAALLLVGTTLRWWWAFLIFFGVVVVNAAFAGVTGANRR